MVIIDDFSKYPLVHVVRSTSARVVLSILRAVFAQFGIPLLLRSDNGPPFQSADFQEFAAELGFHHHRITPLWPQANGEAERFMRTLKKHVDTSSNWTAELDIFLMAYRSTKQATTDKTPYELLFGRKMKNLLPQYFTSNQEEAQMDDVKSAMLHQKVHNKNNADRRRHARPHQLHVGQKVLGKQIRHNKFTLYYEQVPYTITNIKGSQVTASNNKRTVVRNASFFKDATGISQAPDSSTLDTDDLLSRPPVTNSKDADSDSVGPPSQYCPETRYPTRERRPPVHLTDFTT
ncbi:uncharacterized protein LOC135377852 [Ornithodoros turicata]|uniref:uncharacterized protein LOC135377852 n=1 Tax=Ornithodoros turicata TaxID=34597 RepID=UPI0031398458